MQPSNSQSDVHLVDNGTHIILENKIVCVTITKPQGFITEVGYAGIENLLEYSNPESNRGYWDLNWSEPGQHDNFDKPDATTYRVIANTQDRVEVSFVRPYVSGGVPLSIDKRFILLRGDSGFYSYGIYERSEGWPDFDLNQTRITFKLSKELFQFMAIADDKQRIMPAPEDRLPENCEQLAFPEAVILTNPRNPTLKGEVDDKYQYACSNYQNKLHGWISFEPLVGFWIITPSNEFRNGGPTKQDLQSHVGPTCLSMFHSTHFTGLPLIARFRNGEPWRKVFGPVFIYLNSNTSTEANLWLDAKKQMEAEVAAWPYDWPSTKYFPTAVERGTVSGKLLVRDRTVSPTDLDGCYAFVGLAAPGQRGSWQTESKGYQFWTRANEHGCFKILNIRAGTYNLYGWVPGVIGDYKMEESVHVVQGCSLNLGHIIYEPPRIGPTVWEIGFPDRTANKFYIPDPNPKYVNKLFVNHPEERYRQYGLWERYSELNSATELVFIIGKSDWKRDWYFLHNVRLEKDGSILPSTWEIKFELRELSRVGPYKLWIAIASSNLAAIRVHVNASDPIFDNEQFGVDNAIARHGIYGLYSLWSLDIDTHLLKLGENSIYLTQRTSYLFAGVMYDYIRLEVPN